MFYENVVLNDGVIQLVLDKITPEIPEKSWVPAYHFTIALMDNTPVGKCDLRIGYNKGTYYGGNIGYIIEEEYRGNSYASRACKLLFELAKKHKMPYLIITTNPENIPSRKTCEKVKATLVEVAVLPEDNEMFQQGEKEKCIYRIDLNAISEKGITTI